MRVHWNRTRKCWSCREGKRLTYARELTLTDAHFVIQWGARQRTISTGKRTVHAWVEGRPAFPVSVPLGAVKVSYSPWGPMGFVTAGNIRMIRSTAVHLLSDGTLWCRMG